MIILGITGGSGCGKTTVSKLFKENGIDVIDTDLVARIIVEPQAPALLEIKDTFGESYINPDGTLNRKALASLVFSNEKMLLALNSITHKYISKYVNTYINKYTGDIIGIDGAALFESGIDKQCDYILSVLADKETRLARIIKRDGIIRQDAEMRINSQKDDKFYIEKSDYIVYNNSNKEDLSLQIKKIIEDLRSKLWKNKTDLFLFFLLVL